MFVSGLGFGLIILMVLVPVTIAAILLIAIWLNRKRRYGGYLFVLAVLLFLGLTWEASRNGAPFRSSEGLLDLSLGEPVLPGSTFTFRDESSVLSHTGELLGLRLRIGAHILDFPRVGGLHNTLLTLDRSGPEKRVERVSFNDQDRPLRLTALIERARALEAQFAAAGLKACPDSRFRVLDRGGDTAAPPQSWDAAQAMLAARPPAIQEMRLFEMAGEAARVSVTASNWTRRGTGASIFNLNLGREWGLEIWLDSNGKCWG